MDARRTLSASFPVHSYEVDAFGALAVPAISCRYPESAGRHAAELGAALSRALGR